MPVGTVVGLSPVHIVLHANPPPPKKRGTEAPQFSAHVCCGQTAGWIKMPLGREMDVGPGDIVFDGDPAPPKEAAPNFRPMSVVAKRLHGSRCHLVRK